MVSDEELEKFVDELANKKDITQEDKVDESVDEHLGQMGWLWDTVINKLQTDKTCFLCKTEIEEKKQPHVVQASKTEAGVVAFISLCEDCYNKELEKQEEKVE